MRSDSIKSLLGSRHAFTLIELLGVIGIIAILLGIVLGSVSAVQRYSRKAVTQSEVRTIESAWRCYLDYYGFWPTNTSPESGYIDDLSAKGIYHTYKIDSDLGIALDGRCTNNVSQAINPDKIHFMEFSRYGIAENKSAPASPYISSEKMGDGTADNPGCYYFVCFDINGNNDISLDIISKKFRCSYNERSVARPVIVWAVNPDNDGAMIGSWFK